VTGTPSRTATASSRGGVGRKLEAKPRPEVHKSHMRRPFGGRGGVGTRSPMSPGLADVDAAGTRGEGHASYPGRSVGLPYQTEGSSFFINRCREAGDQPRPMDRCALRPWERTQGAQERPTRWARRLGGSRGLTMDRQKSAEAENHGVAWERAKHEEPNRRGAFDA